MKGIKAVFFDAGQTLLDADPPVEEVYRRAFGAHGVEAAPEDVHRAVHATWKEVHAARGRGEERWSGAGGELGFWRRFVEEVYGRVGGQGLPEALLESLVEHFRQEKHWKVYPGTHDVLATLRASGLTLLVVSNWDSSLPSLLDRLELSRFFHAVIVSASFGSSKPSRAIFDEAVRRAGVSPEEALHVGDSLVDDYDGARAAGLQALLVDRAGRHGTGIESIRDLSELPDRVGGRKSAETL